MDRIRKSDVLKGTGKRESVEAMGGTFIIRPLTDGEVAEVQELIYKGLSEQAIAALPALAKRAKVALKTGKSLEDMNFDGLTLPTEDLMAFKKNETDANKVAVAYALSCDGEEWTSEDVAKLPVGIPRKIAQAVFKLSGVSSDQEENTAAAVGRFCETGGPGNSGPTRDGNTPGTHPGTTDPTPEKSVDRSENPAEQDIRKEAERAGS